MIIMELFVMRLEEPLAADLTFWAKSLVILKWTILPNKSKEIYWGYTTRQGIFQWKHAYRWKIAGAILIENLFWNKMENLSHQNEDVCCGFIDDTIVKRYRKEKCSAFGHYRWNNRRKRKKTYSERTKISLLIMDLPHNGKSLFMNWWK